jgi:hemerythrin superfamily protein
MKATDLLKSDHRTVEALFTECRGANPSRKAVLVEQICHELTLHSQLEEEIFYPALGDIGRGPLAEAVDDHRLMRQILDALQGHRPGDGDFQEMLDRLEDLVEDHVDEEESRLFTKAEMLGTAQLLEIGSRMMARREELRHDAVGA